MDNLASQKADSSSISYTIWNFFLFELTRGYALGEFNSFAVDYQVKVFNAMCVHQFTLLLVVLNNRAKNMNRFNAIKVCVFAERST